MKLDEKTLSYFKSQEKYNKPICTIYIDAHGIESTTEKSCKSGAAKVFSFAGVSGAVAYAKRYEKNGKMVPSSVYYREMLSQMPELPIKEKTRKMTKMLKPVLEKVVNETKDPDHIDSWTRKNYKKYGLTPMKQLMKKNYYFSDTSKNRDRYKFGIYVLDVHLPRGSERELIGSNIISNDFLFEFGDRYPEVISFLEEIADTEENRILDELNEEAGIVNDNCVTKMSFEEIIEMMSLMGFEYTFIFDDSCRSIKETPERVVEKLMKITKEERRLSSLKKLPFKMRSADRPKTKKITPRTDRFVNDIRKDFHKKIYDYVCDVLYRDIKDAEIHLMEDVNKKMVFHLFIEDEKMVIEILLDFLKITEIKYDHFQNSRYELFIENIKTLVGKTDKTI